MPESLKDLFANRNRPALDPGRRHILKRRGVSEDDYERLKASQNNRCAICNRPPGKRALAFDHDHETGQARGLLCFSCNAGLGQFQDSAQLLVTAALYLRQYGQRVKWPYGTGVSSPKPPKP